MSGLSEQEPPGCTNLVIAEVEADEGEREREGERRVVYCESLGGTSGRAGELQGDSKSLYTKTWSVRETVR